MDLDHGLLQRFERGLDPQHPEASAVPGTLIGYGEISAIFEVQGLPGKALKRLPLFPDGDAARLYAKLYFEYCDLLAAAGLRLPRTAAAVVEVPGRPAVLYLAQERLPAERVGNKLLHAWDRPALEGLIERVVAELGKVWRFAASGRPGLEIAVDGQISNWVAMPEGGGCELCYIDTSTPFIRRNGVHQIPADLFLQAVPGLLRGAFRRLFLADILNRYYDPRLNLIDLAANLCKEQRPDLVPVAVDRINRSLPAGVEPLDVQAVRKYYREDKLIWTLFLALRRLDRWLTTRVFRKRYEFILPGRIKR